MFNCKVCGGVKFTIISVYKHNWHCCKNCGSCWRVNKKKYAYDFVPRMLKNKLSRYCDFDHLSIESEISKRLLCDMSLVYDYMATEEHLNYRRKVFREFEIFVEKFLDKIDLAGKSVIDISGGNGYFARCVKDKFPECEIIHTEFNQKASLFAKEHFGLNSFVFDFNKEKLSEISSRKFDIIFLRYCINFCTNLKSTLKDFHQCLKPNGLLIVEGAVVPSVEVFYRWQFSDGTYLVLYPIKTLEREITSFGFTKQFSDQGIILPFNHFDWPFKIKPLRKLLKIATNLRYRLPAKAFFKPEIDNNKQITYDFLFKKVG